MIGPSGATLLSLAAYQPLLPCDRQVIASRLEALGANAESVVLMDLDTVLGISVTLASITGVLGLYIWSARRIDYIHAHGLTSLRQIRKELRHGRRSTE